MDNKMHSGIDRLADEPADFASVEGTGSGQGGRIAVQTEGYGSTANRVIVLLLLLLVYMFSFIDRVVAGVAAPVIKAELGLSDSEIGLVTGAAFSVPFILFCMPLGWLADRTNRVRIVCASVGVWSLSTMAFGLAGTFPQLLVSRVGLGMGEAGAGSPSTSILFDYFPRRRLGMVMSIFGFGVPVGTALGIALGAYLISQVGWRMTFVTLGAASLLVGVLVLLFVKEPMRTSREDAVPLRQAISMLMRNRDYTFVLAAISFMSITSFAVTFWIPSLFLRMHPVTLVEFASVFGVIQLVGGVAGAWTGGMVADRWARVGDASYPFVSGIGLTLSALSLWAALLAPTATLAFVFLFLTTTLGAFGNGPNVVAYMRTIPPKLRASASGLFNSTVIGVGMGLGVPLIGVASDLLSPSVGKGSLAATMAIVPAFYLMGAALLFVAGSRIMRDSQP